MIASFMRSCLLLAALGFLGGLLWYAQQIPAAPVDDGPETDAVIVLTGGSQRLAEGFRLLREHKGRELLITGVGKGVKLEELLSQQGIDALGKDVDDTMISLDHAAISTATNAAAAEEWMKEKGFRSARLVTANYHMPRAMLEFGAAMPDIAFYPQPVFPENEFRLDAWYLDHKSLTLLISEYVKYLVTSLKYPQAT